MNNRWSRWLNRMKQQIGQASGRMPGRKLRRGRLNLEALERRDVPSTFTVTTTNDTNQLTAGSADPHDGSGNISIRSALARFGGECKWFLPTRQSRDAGRRHHARGNVKALPS